MKANDFGIRLKPTLWFRVRGLVGAPPATKLEQSTRGYKHQVPQSVDLIINLVSLKYEALSER